MTGKQSKAESEKKEQSKEAEVAKRLARKDKREKDKEVKVPLYDAGAIQRALDDVLVEYLFGKNKDSELAHDLLPLKEVTWHKDVRIALCAVSTVVAVWLYYRAATAPRWAYVGGLALFAVMYVILECLARFWLRGALCVTKEVRRQGPRGTMVALPALRISTGLKEYSADFVLEASWGSRKDQSCVMEAPATRWIDLDGIVHKELFLKEVKAFLTRLAVSAGGHRA